MKNFMMLFRPDPSKTEQPSPEQMAEIMQNWQNWLGGIAAQDKFVSSEALGMQGKLIKADGSTTDGPYAELKEVVGGYAIVKAENFEDAVKLADGCPMYAEGGTVEVRDIMVFDM